MTPLEKFVFSTNPIVLFIAVYAVCFYMEKKYDENIDNGNFFQVFPCLSALAAILLVDHFKTTASKNRRKENRRRRFVRSSEKNTSPSTSGTLSLPYKNNHYVSAMTGYCPDLVDDIEQLAESLEPPKRFLKAVRRDAHDVFQLLKDEASNYNIKIDRTSIAGSIGKGTAIWFRDENKKLRMPDVDCVVIVNDKKPPFEDVLESFAEILEDHPSISKIKTSKRTVQFLYKDQEYGEIKFDLLPAANYVKTHKGNGQHKGAIQAKLALQDVTRVRSKRLQKKGVTKLELSEVNKLYSSSFNENTVQRINAFMEDDFTRKVVHLAKYWNSLIVIDKSLGFTARSCIIEAIAIYAQQKKTAGKNCLISGFRRFLEVMANFGSSPVYLKNGLKNNNPLESLYLELMSASTSSSNPVVLEPSNFFYNLAEGIKPKAVKIFKHEAKETLIILQGLRSRQDYEDVEDAIDEIFSP